MWGSSPAFLRLFFLTLPRFPYRALEYPEGRCY
jgi:hypothetical protein